MSNKSTMLLEHHLKELKLPTFLREYDKLATQCATEGADHPDYLLRLSELELIDRHHRMVDRRIKAARFPTTKSLDTFDFLSMPSLNKALVLELARCEYIERCHNVIVVGNSGTGKTHIALGLGLAACQRGLSVGFTTAAALVHELIEARDERRLLNLQRRLARVKLLIIDELGFVPLSKAGAELLFEVFSQRYERGSVLVTSNCEGRRDNVPPGRSSAEVWRLKTVPPVAFNQERQNLIEGGLDVQGGDVPASSQGLLCRRDERSRGCAGIRTAPGHGAQDAQVLGTSRVSTRPTG